MVAISTFIVLEISVDGLNESDGYGVYYINKLQYCADVSFRKAPSVLY